MRKKSTYKRKQEEVEVVRGPRVQPLLAMNPAQQNYMDCIARFPQTFVTGPAGTGKTYIAAAIAADMFNAHKIHKIILTRPNIPAGKSLGYFAGTIEDKIAPWVIPLTEVLEARIGKGRFEVARKRNDIEIVPFEVMRGRSFNNAFVILDEAQNLTPHEMKMFLTRIGEDSKVIVNGDISQHDLQGASGLKAAIDLMYKHNIPAAHCNFTHEDVVRSGICAMWTKAFD
ncbi:PhoH family protein [Roseobacter phage CRP-114]|uniref:PhoH family protein n=1 Tax=Roseobacter phage CRP-114 TaxID=3072842 RepID=A0AAX3ZY31_9CAUD|nr:PhoH family protein [Roseobacter phage CRP-114]